MEWSLDTIEDMSDESFHLFTAEFGRGVNVVHDGFDIERCFCFLSFSHPALSLKVALGLDLVLCLELCGEVFEEGVVNVSSTEVMIVRSAFNSQLAF